MKKLSKSILILLILLLSISFISACSASKDSAPPQESPSGGNGMPDFGGGSETGSDMDFKDEGPEFEEATKIITTMYLSFETTEFDTTKANLDKLISKYKAYIEESNISYNSYYDGRKYRQGEFTIRVPKKELSSFKAELDGIGNLTSEHTRKENVTKHYRDTESRLRVITTKEERILSLLEKATKIEDIITLENQLTEIIYEKEQLKSSLLNIDDKVEYSTISMDIREVLKLTDQETKGTSFGTRIKNAFNNSLYGFGVGMQDFVIWIIYALPMIIVLVILGFVGIRLLRKVKFKGIWRKKDK